MERRKVSVSHLSARVEADLLHLNRLLNATPMNPPTAYATLTDHTLPITSIAVGLGTFPHCRLLTASLDATCKVSDRECPFEISSLTPTAFRRSGTSPPLLPLSSPPSPSPLPSRTSLGTLLSASFSPLARHQPRTKAVD